TPELPALRPLRQGLVALGGLVADEAWNFRLLAEIHVGGVGDAPALSPVANGVHVDGDHRSDEWLLVTERHRFADVRAELQLVLDELRRERRAVAQRADVLGAIDDDQMPARVDEPRVAGMEPAVGVDDLT